MKFHKILIFLLTAVSTSVMATDSSLASATYKLAKNNGSSNFTETTDALTSSSYITINGVDIKVGVTAWSDSGTNNPDNVLENGSIQGWWSGGNVGYGIENSDYHWGGDSHAMDNSGDGGGVDFDMFLLSFSEAVTLGGASFTWVEGSNGNKEVTVAGLNDISAFESGANSTWSSVTSAIVNNTLGHFGIGSKGSNNLFESKFVDITGSAKYWLVGAYNTIFDTNSNGHFNSVELKLSSLTVSQEKQTPITEVSEPGALALMSLGLGLVLYRRKRRA
ncbi:exosortase-dependent surface protein XDP1 [Alteromonas sp. A081]|uniref:exosortase-dependent surface protein XDP1 n=1 Tax=Alteromonas sp. A081 TaxID=3410269 RepID=UPI003B97E8BE